MGRARRFQVSDNHLACCQIRHEHLAVDDDRRRVTVAGNLIESYPRRTCLVDEVGDHENGRRRVHGGYRQVLVVGAEPDVGATGYGQTRSSGNGARTGIEADRDAPTDVGGDRHTARHQEALGVCVLVVDTAHRATTLESKQSMRLGFETPDDAARRGHKVVGVALVDFGFAERRQSIWVNGGYRPAHSARNEHRVVSGQNPEPLVSRRRVPDRIARVVCARIDADDRALCEVGDIGGIVGIDKPQLTPVRRGDAHASDHLSARAIDESRRSVAGQEPRRAAVQTELLTTNVAAASSERDECHEEADYERGRQRESQDPPRLGFHASTPDACRPRSSI
jgi:hypothetical protein